VQVQSGKHKLSSPLPFADMLAIYQVPISDFHVLTLEHSGFPLPAFRTNFKIESRQFFSISSLAEQSLKPVGASGPRKYKPPSPLPFAGMLAIYQVPILTC